MFALDDTLGQSVNKSYYTFVFERRSLTNGSILPIELESCRDHYGDKYKKYFCINMTS